MCAGTALARRPEQLGRVQVKLALAPKELTIGRAAARILPGHARERPDDRVERRQHTALRMPERGKAEHHQATLEAAVIEAPKRQVMREVEGARRENAPFDPAPPAAIDGHSAGDFVPECHHVVKERVSRSLFLFASVKSHLCLNFYNKEVTLLCRIHAQYRSKR